jgi:hypothetical protein
MQEKPFSLSEKTTIFEAARIALQDKAMFNKIAEITDLNDDELKRLAAKLEKYMQFK